jgi:uncharacterized protein YodC (DUF2158 family)
MIGRRKRRDQISSIAHMFKVSKQILDDLREPPLRIGNVVMLNSGGPRMMIVDFDNLGNVCVSWRESTGATLELVIAGVCVHRVSPL